MTFLLFNFWADDTSDKLKESIWQLGSLKAKVILLLSILLFGFATLAIFTAERLSHMKGQYQSSARVLRALSIYQTQSIIQH